MTQTPQERLRQHTQAEFQRDIITVQPGVYVAIGFGTATTTLIEAEHSAVVIDTQESLEAAELVLAAFRQITDKPIRAILYTHSHRDHVGGASVFAEGGAVEVYARPPMLDLGPQNPLHAALMQRTKRQFGIGLTAEERISLGVGAGERPLRGLGAGYLPPTHIIDETHASLSLDGVTLKCIATPGETDDTMAIWWPEKGLLWPGDNYYKAFPNLYPIRGAPYRDVASWADSLDTLLSLNAETLVPGHTRPVQGREAVAEVLTDYRDAIQHVLNTTLQGMNDGLTPDELVQMVQLPPHLAEKPHLQPFYGHITWAVRSIFAGYLGWFDGNPTRLFPLSPLQEAHRMADLAGGEERLLATLQRALADADYQWAAQLADYLLRLGTNNATVRELKARALAELAEQQMNAPARNYYLYCTRELRDDWPSED